MRHFYSKLLWLLLLLFLLAACGGEEGETAVSPTLPPPTITPEISMRTAVSTANLSTTPTPVHISTPLSTRIRGVIRLPTLTLTPTPTVLSVAELHATRTWGSNYYQGLFIQENLAFLGRGRRLLILDISVPQNPIRIGQMILPGNIQDLKVVNNLAYLALSSPESIGFQIVDVSIPSSPVLLGSYYTAYTINKITIRDNYAYLSIFGESLVLDISDPMKPAFARKGGRWLMTGQCSNEGRTYVLFVDNNYCYTATHVFAQSGRQYEATLHIWDISQPNVLTELGTFSIRGFIEDMKIIDQYAYLSLGYRIEVIDVSDPTAMVSVATVRDLNSGISILKLVDKYAYLVSFDGFTILDISIPAAPFKINAANNINSYLNNHLRISDMIIEDDLAYFVIVERGLLVTDISDPGKPIIIGTYPNGRP